MTFVNNKTKEKKAVLRLKTTEKPDEAKLRLEADGWSFSEPYVVTKDKAGLPIFHSP